MLAAVLALAAVGCLWVLHGHGSDTFSTGIGEQRIVRLADGTRVTLNSSTRLSVAYQGTRRLVRIEGGEAYFEVAKDVTRPFLVDAGRHRVRALGTSFVVRYESQRVAVTLVEGKVAVLSEEPSGPKREIVLTPGERLTVQGKTRARIDAPGIEALTAWRRGEVLLDGMTLAEAVAEMNRYDRTPLVIDDPAIAGLRVSGIYHMGDSETFAKMVAQLYGIRIVRHAASLNLASAEVSEPE